MLNITRKILLYNLLNKIFLFMFWELFLWCAIELREGLYELMPLAYLVNIIYTAKDHNNVCLSRGNCITPRTHGQIVRWFCEKTISLNMHKFMLGEELLKSLLGRSWRDVGSYEEALSICLPLCSISWLFFF